MQKINHQVLNINVSGCHGIKKRLNLLRIVLSIIQKDKIYQMVAYKTTKIYESLLLYTVSVIAINMRLYIVIWKEEQMRNTKIKA